MKLIISLTCIIAMSLPCSGTLAPALPSDKTFDIPKTPPKVSLGSWSGGTNSSYVISVIKKGGKFGPNRNVTDKELADWSERVFKIDESNIFRYIKVNHQGQVQFSSNADNAPKKLLTINEKIVYSMPTISKLRALFDNYKMNVKDQERFTQAEIKEINDFVDAVLATPAMDSAMAFLQRKNKVGCFADKRREYFKSIWFDTYARDKNSPATGSSGFEHVFLGELKKGKLMGLHNWVYLYEAEKKGKIDYKGYMKLVPLGNKGEIIKLRLCSPDKCKPISSIFVGISPELEMALYTVCFILRPNRRCPMVVRGKRFVIKTYTFKSHGRDLVGSAFVEVY